jgi:hypothetical protein
VAFFYRCAAEENPAYDKLQSNPVRKMRLAGGGGHDFRKTCR